MVEARKFAKQLQNSEAYLRVQAAIKANDESAELQAMIQEFNDKRIQMRDNYSSELGEEVKQSYEALMLHPGMVEYSQAKAALDKKVEYIKYIIERAAAGEDPEEIELEDCSGDCGGCSGC